MPRFEISETTKFVRSGVVDAANEGDALRLLNIGKAKLKMQPSPDVDLQIHQLDQLEDISEEVVLSPCA